MEKLSSTIGLLVYMICRKMVRKINRYKQTVFIIFLFTIFSVVYFNKFDVIPISTDLDDFKDQRSKTFLKRSLFENGLIQRFPNKSVESITFDIHDFSKYPLVDQEILENLKRFQNKSSCSGKKLLVFKPFPCGFGCQLHQIAAHLHTALETNRTLIVYNSKFNNENFMQISMTECNVDFQTLYQLNQPNPASINITDDQIIFTNTIIKAEKIKYYALEQMENKAKKLNVPLAWYVAQFVGYIIQYSDKFKTVTELFAKEIGFKSSCVGIHVRQTDKATETKLFVLQDYMRYVDAYYEKYPFKKKCIFLITDEKDIIREAKEK